MYLTAMKSEPKHYEVKDFFFLKSQQTKPMIAPGSCLYQWAYKNGQSTPLAAFPR